MLLCAAYPELKLYLTLLVTTNNSFDEPPELSVGR